jgi:hypothetical protein
MKIPNSGGWKICRKPSKTLLLFASLAFSLSAGPIIQFQVAPVGTTGGETLYRYTYTVSGVAFAANEELDIQFDPALYGQLSNGMAPGGFDLLLFQPNNPPQAAGDYSALALAANPSPAGIFSVDFTLTGPGTPGAQAFSFSQFDSSGNFVCSSGAPAPCVVPAAGVTTALVVGGVPEPASFWLSGSVLILGGVVWAVRRRSPIVFLSS